MSNPLCKCGHRHDDHGPTMSVNYTGGKCSCCECRNFLMAKDQPRDMGHYTVMENHFYSFLKREGYDKDKLSEEFTKALEEAFYGGASSALIFTIMADEAGQLEVSADKLIEELKNYWTVENLKDKFKIE